MQEPLQQEVRVVQVVHPEDLSIPDFLVAMAAILVSQGKMVLIPGIAQEGREDSPAKPFPEIQGTILQSIWGQV